MSTPDPDTISLDSRINHTVQIYGRTYQEVALEKGTSFSPVDDEERDRLNRIHEILQLMFAGKLLFPPVSNPRRVLDCGYGSGAWCVGVAEAYPECEVIGVDVSPHMKPDDIPANVWLQVDDLNEPFTFQSNHFDLIHSRNVVTGINIGRWQSYIQDCVRVLRPGGWLQCIEVYHNVQSDNGSLTDRHAIRQLSSTFIRAMEGRKDMRAPLHLESMMRTAGLLEIESRMIPLPLNGWPTSPLEREIGERMTGPYKEAIGGNIQVLLSQSLGMSMEEIHVLIASARMEVGDISLKLYVALYISIGRKPNS